MRLICTILGAAILLHAGGLDAQTAAQATPPPLAPGPLLNFAPASSQWLVSITSGSNGPAIPNAQTKYDERVLVTKSGDIRYEITEKGDGEKLQKWCQGAMQATVVPGVSDPMFATSGASPRGNAGYTDYTKTDFPGFEWIRRKNYIGVQSMEGVPCIVFNEHSQDQPPSTATAAASPSPAAGPGAATATTLPTGNTAYISAEGRLPVLLVTDNTVTFYQFRTPPATILTLPPAVAELFAEQEARLHQLAAPAGGP